MTDTQRMNIGTALHQLGLAKTAAYGRRLVEAGAVWINGERAKASVPVTLSELRAATIKIGQNVIAPEHWAKPDPFEMYKDENGSVWFTSSMSQSSADIRIGVNGEVIFECATGERVGVALSQAKTLRDQLDFLIGKIEGQKDK